MRVWFGGDTGKVTPFFFEKQYTLNQLIMLHYTITIKDEKGAEVCRYHVAFETIGQVLDCANDILSRSARTLSFELNEELKGGEE